MEDIKIYIGNQFDPKDRLLIYLTEEEYQKIPPRGSRSRRIVTVKDNRSGKEYRVRRAACGLPNCRCALLLADGSAASKVQR